MLRKSLLHFFTPLLASAAIGITFAGCQRMQKPIRIGLAINLSGTGGSAGEYIRDGAQLAVQEVNEQGGINGRPLQLLIRDDRNTKKGIEAADRSLLDAGVLAIIGHSTSSDTLAAYPMVTGHNVILITPFGSTTKLSGKNDLFLRTAVDCKVYGEKMARLLARKKAKKVSVLMDMANADFVVDYLKYIRKNFAGTLFQVPFNSRKDVDWPKLVAQLTAPAPDTVILLTEATMTGIALQKLEQAGFTGNRIATGWAQRPKLLRLAGSAAEGLAIVTIFNPQNSSQKFLELDRKMLEKFGNPANDLSCRSHEIVFILADALRRCKRITVPNLKAALLQGHYHTSLGEISFDPDGDVVRPVFEVVVKHGQLINNGEIH